MKLTLMQVLMVSAAAPMLAAAQVPPTPPRAPVPAPAPKPPVVVTPRIKFDPQFELHFEQWGPKLDELRWQIEDMHLHELEMPKLDFEYMRMQAKDMELLAKEQV